MIGDNLCCDELKVIFLLAFPDCFYEVLFPVFTEQKILLPMASAECVMSASLGYIA